MAKLPEGSYSDRAEVVTEIGATGGRPRRRRCSRRCSEGELQRARPTARSSASTGKRRQRGGFDPLTGAELGPVAARSTEAIKVNNSPAPGDPLGDLAR